MKPTLNKLIILVLVLAGIFAAMALYYKDKNVYPSSLIYKLKLVGEWLDVNVLTFGAPEKQQKHLDLAQRRLDEFLQSSATLSQGRALDDAYELELARAEFMAEQLTLLDHKFLPNIEHVYVVTLNNSQTLWDSKASGPADPLNDFLRSAQLYNSKSIKRLLQKHQYSVADTAHYKDLVEQKLKVVQSSQQQFTQEQLATLEQAKKILAEGREIEWAYDLISSVK